MEENRAMSEEHQDTLQNVVTEQELLKLTGLKKSQLAVYRNTKRLPFLKVNQRCRLYLERDVVDWLKSFRLVINPE